MTDFLNLVLQDTILLLATMVFVSTVVILVWALKSLKNPLSFTESIGEIHEEQPEHNEESGLLEARLEEINNQIHQISRDILEIKKNLIDPKKSLGSTIPIIPASTDIEKAIKRIETMIVEQSNSKAGIGENGSTGLANLEAKLNGIHKLLIHLTNSGT